MASHCSLAVWSAARIGSVDTGTSHCCVVVDQTSVVCRSARRDGWIHLAHTIIRSSVRYTHTNYPELSSHNVDMAWSCIYLGRSGSHRFVWTTHIHPRDCDAAPLHIWVVFRTRTQSSKATRCTPRS